MSSQGDLDSAWCSRLSPSLLTVSAIVSLAYYPAAVMAGQSEIGSVVVGDEKKIVIGWFKGGDGLDVGMLDESREHGFDFVMPYYIFKATEAENPSNVRAVLNYLDEAERRGVKVMIDVHTLGGARLPRAADYLMAPRVNAVKDHPALFGYYLEDEPDSRHFISGSPDMAPEHIAANHDVLRALDPDPAHLVCIAYAMNLPTTEAQSYFPACDLVAAECYPTAWNPTYPSEYPFVPADVEVAKSAGLGYVTLPRLFADPYIGMPTPDEFRYMVFAPISMGAGGVVPFVYDGFVGGHPEYKPDPGFREAIVYPATDILRSIRPTLLKGDLLATSRSGDDMTWVFGGDAQEAVLVAVNNSPDTARTSVEFTLTGLARSLHEADVLGENRMVALDVNRSFADDFAPYGVHVYRFRP